MNRGRQKREGRRAPVEQVVYFKAKKLPCLRKAQDPTIKIDLTTKLALEDLRDSKKLGSLSATVAYLLESNPNRMGRRE